MKGEMDMRNRFRVFVLLLTMIVGVSMLAGCAVKQPGTPGKVHAAAPENSITLTLYFGNEQADALVKETRVVERSGEALESVVLKELIKGPQTPAGRVSIPKEATVISVRVEDKVAYVDLAKDVVEYHWGGSAGDAMTIGSIVHSLTELPGIENVQLLLEGRVEEAMFGHIATNEPIGR